MKAAATRGRSWRIGELARATGLTVRTLRHYESLGLLPRPPRTRGRQRLYDERDVRRTYRIRALRELGLSLQEVGRVLASGAMPLRAVLRAHQARVEEEIERLREVQVLLRAASARAEEDVDAETMIATIEAMSRVARHGRARPRAQRTDVEARWRKLGEELRSCMVGGEPPSGSRPGALARAARDEIVAFAGGDPALLESLAHLRRFAPPPDLAGWDPPLLRYLDAALSSLEESEDAERTDRPRRRPRKAADRLGGARRSSAPHAAAGDGPRQSARALAAGVPARAAGARASRRPL